jgi:hypothetical protein
VFYFTPIVILEAKRNCSKATTLGELAGRGPDSSNEPVRRSCELVPVGGL